MCFIEKLSYIGIGDDSHGAPSRVGGTASQYGHRLDTPMASPTHSAAPTLEVYREAEGGQRTGAGFAIALSGRRGRPASDGELIADRQLADPRASRREDRVQSAGRIGGTPGPPTPPIGLR
jgi:hypothetical protein